MTQVLEELRGVIDRLVDTDPRELADTDSQLELHRELARLDGVATRSAAVFDGGGSWRESGARSAAHWLAFSAHEPIAKAQRRVRVGTALAELPVVEAAWMQGRISECHASAIANLLPVNPEAMTRDEEDLVGWAETESFNAFLRGLKYWTYENDPDFSDAGAERMHARRELRRSRRNNGMLDGNFLLDPIGGEIFDNELRRIEEEFFEADWAEANRRRDAGRGRRGAVAHRRPAPGRRVGRDGPAVSHRSG